MCSGKLRSSQVLDLREENWLMRVGRRPVEEALLWEPGAAEQRLGREADPIGLY